jgi:hypothetical protein
LAVGIVMGWLVLLGWLVAGSLLLQWLKQTQPALFATVWRQAVVAGLLGLLLLIVARGGLTAALPVLLLAAPLVWREWQRLQPPAARGSPRGPGGGSGTAGQERQEQRREPPRGSGGSLDRAEAYAILGLQPGASREAIKAAHRRLLQRVHPDHGGSDYLAARINRARDLLLGDR